MRYRSLAVIVILGLLIAGCSDSPEKRMQKAHLAMKQQKPNIALEELQKVLDAEPTNTKAMLMKARAQMQLLHVDQAKATVEQLLIQKPDDVEVHEAAVQCAFFMMQHAMNQSDFLTNNQQKLKFDDGLMFGRQQVDWLAAHDYDAAKVEFLRARLASNDARRYARELGFARTNTQYVDVDGRPTPEGDREFERLRRSMDERRDVQLTHLKAVLAQAPSHVEASRMYVGMLAEGQSWVEMWDFCNKLVETKDISAELSNTIVLAMLSMPGSFKPIDERMDMGWKLQEVVKEKEKESPAWQITSARLHIMGRDPDKALPLLDKIIEKNPKHVDARYLKAQGLFLLRRFQDAKALLTRLANEKRTSQQVQSLYGRTLVQTGDAVLAKEALRRAIELGERIGRDDPLARQAFLTLLAQDGHLEEARPEVDAYYRRSPTDANAIRFKLQFEQISGNQSEVATVLANVASISPLANEHLMILVEGYRYLQKWDQVEQISRELIRREPEMLPARIWLAEAMLVQNKDEQVRQMLGELREQYPNSANVDILLGQLYVQRQSWDRAIGVLEGAVDNDPDNAQGRLLLARAYAGKSMPQDALEQIQAVLDQHPHDVGAHALAARIYQFVGESDRAEEHLSQIDESQLDERSGPGLLAQIKIKKGELDEAAAVCNRAIAAGNTDPVLRLLLALIYRSQNKPAEAEANLLALLQSLPDNPQVWALIARFYREQRAVDKGVLELDRLQRLNEPLARLAQAALLNSAGRSDEALTRLEPLYGPLLTDRDPKARELIMSVADAIARIHLSRGDRDAAVKVYDRMIAANTQAAQARLRQIDLMAQVDEPSTTVEKLDKLVEIVSPDERDLRYELMRRYVSLRRHDRALEILDEWIKRQPDQVVLMRWKSQLLSELGQSQDAVDELKRAIAMAPDNSSLHMRLARAYVEMRDYAAAEAALMKMGELDAAARTESLAALGEMFMGLGLNHQATTTFNELERVARPRDPRVIFAMGRALAAMGQDNQARTRLADVPPYAPQYAAAQLLLAKIEQRQGAIEQAKQRLTDMARDPRMAQHAARELLTLNLLNRQDEDLIRWSDTALSFETLPDLLKRQWLRVRVFVSANQKNWLSTLDSLNHLSELEPGSYKVSAARILVMLREKRDEQAKRIYTSIPTLSKSPVGPLLAVLLGEPIPANVSMGPVGDYLFALSQGDVATARKAAMALAPMKTLYRQDMLALLDRSDAASPQMAASARQLMSAMVAIDAGLPQLAREHADAVIRSEPGMAPAYGLLIQSLLDMREPTQDTLTVIRRTMPSSSLTMFLSSLQKLEANDYEGALRDTQDLLRREGEPVNVHARYTLAMLYHKTGRIDDAVGELEKIWLSNDPYRVLAGNDLAYLLAIHKPQRLDEAAQIAKTSYSLAQSMPQLLDTIGWIEHLRGQNQVALEFLNQAVTSLPESAEVHYHLGVVYKALGKNNWARYHLSEAARSSSNAPEVRMAKDMLDGLQG